MKSSKQNSSKLKSNLLYSLVLLISFFLFAFLNKERLFQNFDPNVVNRYLKSQDIFDEKDVIKDRVIVSDEEIYIASGYLYANGKNPIDFNFQHPPLVKYLFGLSSKYLNLPLLPNIIFAGILIFEIYLLGKLLFKSELVGLLASVLLLLDPVFKEVTTYALLDLGQMVFILGFIITTFYYKKHFIGQGVLLGLAMASKFYSPVVIFLGLIYIFKLFTKDINIKQEIYVLLIAFVTFCSVYIVSFENKSGLFNIFFYQAKIIKFMVEHNRAVEWGSVIKMLFEGYIIWPILFLINIYVLFNTKISRILFLVCLLPIIYFVILMFQIPFTRYFVLLLPFLYLVGSNFVVLLTQKHEIK